MDALIAQIYQAATDARQWDRVLTRTARHFGAATGSFMLYRGLEAVDFRTTSRTREARDAVIDQCIWESTEGIEHVLGTPIHRFVTAEQYFPPELLAQSQWKRAMGPQAQRHKAGTAIRLADDYMAIFTVHRHADQGPFAPAQLARLDQMRTHLASAVQLAVDLSQRSARQTPQVLQGIGQAAAVLGPDGVLLACNPLFESQLAQWAEPDARQRVLLRDVRAQPRWDAAWARLRRLRPGGAGVTPAPVVARGLDGHIWRLQLHQSVGANGECLLGGHALLTVRASSSARPPSLPDTSSQLRQRYGLTEQEARLSLLLAAGTPLRQAAHLLGLSHHSGRTYLYRVFTKVGVHRQADLVRLVLEISR